MSETTWTSSAPIGRSRSSRTRRIRARPAAPLDKLRYDGIAAVNLTLEPIAARDAVRYEAEAAALTGADVRQGVASGGAYVGSLDELGETLSFSVAVTDAAEYWLWINYVNGSLCTTS